MESGCQNGIKSKSAEGIQKMFGRCWPFKNNSLAFLLNNAWFICFPTLRMKHGKRVLLGHDKGRSFCRKGVPKLSFVTKGAVAPICPLNPPLKLSLFVNSIL